jgi:uncharacterized protein (TIGR04255 family)
MAFEFNLHEEFPHLSNAPIVEAVLQINARATSEWTQQTIVRAILDQIGDSNSLVPENASERTFQLDLITGLRHEVSSSYWQGARVAPMGRPEIVRFTRDFFAYSRLLPYEDWGAFLQRAMYYLNVHIQVAQPGIAQRIGLRFINRIPMSQSLNLEEYLTNPPTDTSGVELPISGFLYHSSFQTPGYPYAINLSRTLQQTANTAIEPPALILDIDVFTVLRTSMDENSIGAHLQRMRWLKNKIFFGSITTDLQERLR